MSDFEVAQQLLDTIGLFLDAFALIASLIFAYVTGAFYFLHRAPLFTKIISFVFFVFAMSFVMVLLLGTYFHFLALIDQVEAQMANPDVAYIIQATHEGRTRAMATLGFWIMLPVMIGTVLMCLWMTFFWGTRKASMATPSPSA